LYYTIAKLLKGLEGVVVGLRRLGQSDMIGCNESGESSDYDSVIEVAKEKGIAEISKEVQQPDW
jgi:hypothetical protein